MLLGFVVLFRDHPRVCGENLRCFQLLIVIAGSPPRVRGKRALPRQASQVRGITPACAGKTDTEALRKRYFRDHPRVCGENPLPDIRISARPGSPPRVRGKLQPVPRTELCIGITPACAGKTGKRTKFCRVERDHPRVCGENKETGWTCAGDVGSPPRVRGKPSRSAFTGCSPRITPACAGKTSGVLLAQKK